jgi:hypothetical protein
MLMQRLTSSTLQPAPGLVGVLLLAQLGLVRTLASATGERVYVFGRELPWGCWFKQQFKFPCPTCGLTRSVLLTLQGQFGEAVQLNPAGLLLVLGLLLFGLALIFLMFYQQRHTGLAVGTVHRRLRTGTSLYAGVLIVVLFAHWFIEIASR